MMHKQLPGFNINDFINYCENTLEESWCVDVVRTENGANCLFGHIATFANDETDLLNQWFSDFEECYATTYMVYPVSEFIISSH